jgi:hypothetical protein
MVKLQRETFLRSAPAFDSLAISTYTHSCVLGMAERDAAIDMLAGLLGRAAQDGESEQDKPTIFRSPQTVSSARFFHDELRPLKEPMISTNC